jgi:hypothetical protein
MSRNQITPTRVVPVQPDRQKAVEAMQQSGNLLTPDKAAERLGVSVRVLERLRGTGDGPDFIKLTSKTLRYRLEDLDAFVISNVRRNTAR